MSRQEYWRSRYREIHPEWDPSSTLFRRLIAPKIGPDTRILDIGAGHTDFLRDIYERTPLTYAIDLDAEAIRRNRTIANKVIGNAERLPFKDGSFDLVVLSWVVEHLDHPQGVFREIHRVLKPGGAASFLTPNTWNYNVWMILLVPNTFHGLFTRRLYGRHEHDSFPTRYRLNSVRRLDSLLTRMGFERDQMILNGDPTYISFNELLFRFACLLERLLDTPSLQRARVHIIGAYRKKGGSVDL